MGIFHFLNNVSLKWCPPLSMHCWMRPRKFCITLTSISWGIRPISSCIAFLRAGKVLGRCLYTSALRYPHRKKSQGAMSGDRAGSKVWHPQANAFPIWNCPTRGNLEASPESTLGGDNRITIYQKWFNSESTFFTSPRHGWNSLQIKICTNWMSIPCIQCPIQSLLFLYRYGNTCKTKFPMCAYHSR